MVLPLQAGPGQAERVGRRHWRQRSRRGVAHEREGPHGLGDPSVHKVSEPPSVGLALPWPADQARPPYDVFAIRTRDAEVHELASGNKSTKLCWPCVHG